jgi:DNA-binding PadR family transcriptional regulator
MEKRKDIFKQDLPIDEDVPTELTPLREPTLFILLTLSKERKHGYAILKDVEALSEGRVVLSTGTLYGALARLLAQGVIRKSKDDNASSGPDNRSERIDNHKRKYYELTQFGQRVLALEIKRMGTILATVNRELGAEGI